MSGVVLPIPLRSVRVSAPTIARLVYFFGDRWSRQGGDICCPWLHPIGIDQIFDLLLVDFRDPAARGKLLRFLSSLGLLMIDSTRCHLFMLRWCV